MMHSKMLQWRGTATGCSVALERTPGCVSTGFERPPFVSRPLWEYEHTSEETQPSVTIEMHPWNGFVLTSGRVSGLQEEKRRWGLRRGGGARERSRRRWGLRRGGKERRWG